MKIKLYLALALLFSVFGIAQATNFPSINQAVAICDPNFPNNCLAPSGGGLPITVTSTTNTPVAPAAPTATNASLVACQFVTAGVTFTNLQQGSLSCAANGELMEGGGVASGTTDSGNPQKIGAKFNTVAPTFSDGQRGDIQIDANGAVAVASKTATAAVGDATGNTVRVISDRTGNIVSVGQYPLIFNGTTWDRYRQGAYQLSQTPIAAASGNVANASAVATLAGVAAKTTYLTGFELTAGGATAGACFSATVTGTISTTLTYTFCVPTGAAVGATPLNVSFVPPVPASAVNTAIVVTLPALGAGNTNATTVAHGYQQ